MTKEDRIDWLCRLRSFLVTVDMPKDWRTNFAQALSEKIDSESQWIPVTKRLPKDSKAKVVTLIDGSTEAGWYYSDSDGEWWCIGDYMALDNRTVIAWMELPEAWKG